MKRLLLTAVFVLAACEAPLTDIRQETPAVRAAVGSGGSCVIFGKTYARGFNENGYNYCARNFVGPADGVDKLLDGTVWGDPKYAQDHLVMKWNEEWDRGNAEGWTDTQYAAWEDNEWNGKVAGGSGEVWHYKIKWSAPCRDGVALTDGGYCVWGQFEVVADHGTAPDAGHSWLAHATPNGYGAH